MRRQTLAGKAADKVPFVESIGFALGNFGTMFIWNTMALFMVYFLTDVAGIGAAMAGIILFSARFIDALIDPVIGFISDRTHTRWGQKKPFILAGAVPVALLFALCWVVPDLSHGGLYAYYAVVLLLMWVCYSIYNVPYNALVPVMTRDAAERSKLSGYYNVLTLIGVLLSATLAKPIVAAFPTERIGWQWVGMLFGAVTLGSLLVTVAIVKERFPADQSANYKAKDIVRLLWGNKPFMVLSAVALLALVAFTLMGILLTYLFKYGLHNETLLPVALGALLGTSVIFVPIWVLAYTRIGKKASYMLSLSVYALSLMSVYFIQTAELSIILPVCIICGIGGCGVQVGLWGLLPDTVEYAHLKLGARTEGVQYGFYGFVIKLGASVAALIAGAGLALSGYVANAVQSESALLGIRLLGSFVPAAFIVIAMLVFSYYPITEKMHQQILQDLNR